MKQKIKYSFLSLFILICNLGFTQTSFFVSTQGNDNNPGTIEQPFASLKKAKQAIDHLDNKSGVTVFLRKGTYFLTSPVELGPEHSGTKAAPLTFKAYGDENVTISGGVELFLKWESRKKGIYRAKVDQKEYGSVAFDQLFIDGQLQRMARYPNYDETAQFFKGTAKNSNPEFIKRYDKIHDPGFQQFMANVTQVDEAVGQIVNELKEQGIYDETLIWYTSDNGPAGAHEYGSFNTRDSVYGGSRFRGSSGGLRGRKSHTHEGGIRVPGIIS